MAESSPLEALVFDYELGPAYVFRNEGRYGATGTGYEADQVGQQRVLVLTQRPSVEWVFSERHRAVLLYAPVRLRTRVRLDRALTFRETTFPAGSLVEHLYRFDGYRGSYLFRALKTRRWRLDAGVSLQVRSAEVEFIALQSERYANESDIGPVPALKLRARYDAPWGAYAMLDLDGLTRFGIGEGSGGLLDAALTLGFPTTPSTDVFLRLRFYGGGAVVPERELTSYAWFGIAAVGVRSDLVALLR